MRWEAGAIRLAYNFIPAIHYSSENASEIITRSDIPAERMTAPFVPSLCRQFSRRPAARQNLSAEAKKLHHRPVAIAGQHPSNLEA
jgi:hypothetical protein